MGDDGKKVVKVVAPSGFPYEIIEVPNKLAEKAGNFHVDKAKVRRIETKLASLATNFPSLAQGELRRLAELWQSRKRAPDDETVRRELEKLAHDFKGEGGTVGYPLVTEIAASLLLLLRHGDIGREETRAAVDAHIGALHLVLASKITGDGGEHGRELTNGLRASVTKCCGGRA